MADIKVGDKVRIDGEVVSGDSVYLPGLGRLRVKLSGTGEIGVYHAADVTLVPPEPVTTLWTADCGHEVTDDTEVCVTPSETYCPQCAGNMIRELSGL